MSNKIKILPENISSKIAAGEVVQRPESVVKELLENSIDAGSKTIELIVKRAGKSLIQVCDDGIGMTEEDAVLCIQKHATSKVSSLEDLDAIRTLGFRGEALSSIAAVSRLEIKTETRDREIGTFLRLEENGVIKKEKGSFPKGTCITVKNLFYNVPARRNFLKSDATELKHIIDTFNKISLSHPEINFKLYNEDDLIFVYAEGSLEERIKQVFADNMLDALIPVEEKTEFLNVTGYVGKPTLLKKSKGEQYIFLNNRYVISKQLNHAVFTAFENILEKGDYPFFILFLDLDPSRIDVNVHPSKLEVRFENEKDIYSFLLAVVRKGLGMHDLVPSMSFVSLPGTDQGLTDAEKLKFNNFHKIQKNDFSDRPFLQKESERRAAAHIKFSDEDIDLIFSSITSDLKKSGDSSPSHPFAEKDKKEVLHTTKTEAAAAGASSQETSFIIQLHNRYILSQIKSGLMIIDQHVAHERVLYEKALARLEADLPFAQHLLFPKTLELNPGIYSLIKELNPFLVKLGFEVKFFSKNTIVIEGVPDDVKPGSEEKVLLEIIDEYAANQREKKLDETDNVAKSYSCKTAIKSGDKLSEKEMRLLIDQLFATSMPYVCPHGRPIVVKISLDEFDRRFGRS
ncbi:MAG TPA: DNA mismatch repair endonuclease MutL [Ignavibacteriaceae bacterium]|nr:DNA mismatch repair endonuclease MutL [Ignavibacteriaceae bacterium]